MQETYTGAVGHPTALVVLTTKNETLTLLENGLIPCFIQLQLP